MEERARTGIWYCLPAGGVLPVLIRMVVAWTVACSATLAAGEGILVRTNPRTYRVLFRSTAVLGKKWPDRLLLLLPLAESSAYQDVRLLGPVPGREKRIGETGDAYLERLFSGSELRGGTPAAVEYECEVTLYDIRVDFSRVRATEPYRRDAEYRLYTGKSGEYVNPNHPEIMRISLELASVATDTLDYARRAYEFVAKNYRFINRKGFSPLDSVLDRGGGHCGDLSAIFISLLRRAGIPARHLAGHLVNDKTHIIAEFLVEGCGWIPVDVTYRMSHPDEDFFGNIPRDSMPIVISRNMSLPVDGLSGVKRVASLQRGWGFWKPKHTGTRMRFHTECRPVH